MSGSSALPRLALWQFANADRGPRLPGRDAAVDDQGRAGGERRGIGEAIARACVDAGAKVALASRKQADLDSVASSLPADRAVALACHTGKPDDVDAMFARAVERFGRVDGLVNNAATNPYFGPLIDTPDAAIDKTFEVIVKGYLYCARALVRHARSRGGGGAIVNIASIAGMRAALMQGIYGATKAAVISMTQTLASELGSSKIRVNAIAPGLVETPWMQNGLGAERYAETVQSYRAIAALDAVIAPDEVAEAAWFLGVKATKTTGEVLLLDAGRRLTRG